MYRTRVPCPPPIAASLILPAIFWGQNYVPVRPYALTFSFFPFLYSFWYFLFVILFLFFSPFYFFSFISSYPSLLISSYSSYSSRTILRLLILLFLYLNLFVVLQTCRGPSLFWFIWGQSIYLCDHLILLFISLLILLFLSLLILLVLYSSSSYSCITDMRIKHTLGKVTYMNGKINNLQRKPRENSSLAKNPPKYTTAYIVQ